MDVYVSFRLFIMFTGILEVISKRLVGTAHITNFYNPRHTCHHNKHLIMPSNKQAHWRDENRKKKTSDWDLPGIYAP
jgi:hypothetical protein